jgi:hypothetical protein
VHFSNASSWPGQCSQPGRAESSPVLCCHPALAHRILSSWVGNKRERFQVDARNRPSHINRNGRLAMEKAPKPTVHSARNP